MLNLIDISINKYINKQTKNKLNTESRNCFSDLSKDVLTPKKIKELAFYIPYEEFNKNNMLFKMSDLKLDKRYSIIVRVQYKIINKDKNKTRDFVSVTDWKMLDKQIGFYLDNYIIIKYLYEIIKNRLKECEDTYDIPDDYVLGLQFIVYDVYYTNIVVKKEWPKFKSDSLGINEDLIHKSKIENIFNNIVPVPYSNLDKQLLELDKNVNNGVIDSILLKDGSYLDIQKEINKHNNDLNKFTLDTKFYQNIKNNYINVVSYNIDSNVKVKKTKVYTTQGLYVGEALDYLYDNNTYKRITGNISIFGNEKEIFKKEIDIQFNPIHTYELKGPQSKMVFSDPNFGTIDLETYNVNNKAKTYAIGYHVDNETKLFYINKDLNSEDLILKCLDSLLCDKYNGFVFYMHNFGNYDGPFILKVLELNNNQLSYDPFFRDDILYSVNISKKRLTKNGKVKHYNIKINDSYRLLSSSLNELCVTFNPTTKKSIFPYDFVKENTIFYEGKKPGIDYYYNKWLNIIEGDEKKKDTKILYDAIPDNNWSTKQETLKYLTDDLVSLYLVLKEFSRRIYKNYYVHTTKSLTISGLALDIFLRDKKNGFYKNNIPLINKRSIYNDIKNSYYGGITEVYKPYGNKLYYYDVNSLYPYSALNDMPGLNCKYVDVINKDISKCDNLFGFYYCKVFINNNYFGLLPVRTDEGITMPLGSVEGWYFSEELKFAYQNGCKIDIIKGYEFSRESNTFYEYVKHFYGIKSTTSDYITKAIAKSLLNNLLGRLGLKLDKRETKLVSDYEYNELLQSKDTKLIAHIGDKRLVSVSQNMSIDICDSHNVDFNKTFNNIIKHGKNSKTKYSEEKLKNISIAISSAVTAYSRIYMNKIKLDIIKKGGSVYYTDTDSIVTNIELDTKLIGSEIGKFKLEYILDEAYFISSKLYCISGLDLKTGKQKEIVKTKGAKPIGYDNEKDIYNKLSINDFKKLYEGENVNAIRLERDVDFKIGSVIINKEQKVNLHYDSYKKRNKIFENNKWVDTKPLVIKRPYHSLSNINKIYKKNTIISYIIKLSLIFILYFLFIYVFTYKPLPTINIEDYDSINLCINIYSQENLKSFSYTDISIIDYLNELKWWWIDIFSNKKNIYDVNHIHICKSDFVVKQIYNTNTDYIEKPKIIWNFYNMHLNRMDQELVEQKQLVSSLMINLLRNRVEALDDYREYLKILDLYNNL